MNWQERLLAIQNGLKGLYGSFKVSGEESPEVLRKKQRLFVGIGTCAVLVGLSYALGVFDFTSSPPQTSGQKSPAKPVEQSVADLSTPLSGIKEGDIWVSRIEKLVKSSQAEMEKIKSENLLLEKKIDTLVGALGKIPGGQEKIFQDLENQAPSSPSGLSQNLPSPGSGGVAPAGIPSPGPRHFPALEKEAGSSSSPEARMSSQFSSPSSGSKGPYPGKKKKLLHLSNYNPGDHSRKSPETYLPAGTYFKVVTAMGVVVSTGTNSSSDPQPILLRIVDNGNLPGGLKGKVKDAVLIGACYGSASAERAICRLKTLSWRDKTHNRTIEKPVEGWIASEDGVQGIRAKIIDRSSEIAREAFGAGLLSAASNFFKMEATSGVYPMTPFGQTNAMSKTDALKAGLGGGVGSAMDKLAEFSIKRAESMSPVAYVASGRVLDAVLMRGVDLSPLSEEALTPINSTPENQPQSNFQGDIP